MTELLGLPDGNPVEVEDGTKRRMVLEGGSIDTNGAGILLTTEECLLSEVQQRNPGLSREQLEQVFHDYLGIVGHLARPRHRGRRHPRPHRRHRPLRRRRTIVAAVEPDTRDPNHAPLAENLARLKAARTPQASNSHWSSCPCRVR